MKRSTVIFGIVAFVVIMLAPVSATWAGNLPPSAETKTTNIDCEYYSPLNKSYQESFDRLLIKLPSTSDSAATGGRILDEFIQCFARSFDRSGNFIFKDRGGAWGFLGTKLKINLNPLFPVEVQKGVRLRKVSDNTYAILTSISEFGYTGIHILKKDSNDSSNVHWHSEADTFTVLRYGALGAVPFGVDEDHIKDNLDILRAANIYAQYKAGDTFSSVSFLSEKFGLQDEPRPSIFCDNPKSYHKVGECILDPRMFTDVSGLQVSNFWVKGWRAFRIKNSSDIHFLYLGYADGVPANRLEKGL